MNLMKNKKILLQLSGGKDSVACFLFLKQESLNFETIHFTHSYSYEIPTNMVKKICSRYKIKLTIINIEKELNKLFLNNFNKRPCRYCKSIMDSKTIEYATRNNFDLICVGDTKDDSMLVNRIKTEKKSPDIKLSKYFNERVLLPNNILIY
ncbi:MAG: ATP-binding protein, partial [Spirochaetota bacterium]|nr:ATP-binding protein [Spirochaetota bacterium]